MKLWIVGQFVAEVEHSGQSRVLWEFAGVFDTKEAAIAACRNETYSISEAILNETVPEETHAFPVCWYPHIEEEPAAQVPSNQHSGVRG